MSILLGLDIGTSGARAVAVRVDGAVVHTASAPLPQSVSAKPGWAVQNPEDWWAAAQVVLGEIAAHLPANEPVLAIAVDSTSGTVVPVDDAGDALFPALMYNDGRATEAAADLNNAGAALCESMGYRFNASFALAKILWFRRRHPELYERTRCFLHAADFIVHRLSGEMGVSDTSNVLKTGYDLPHNKWPEWLGALDLDSNKLPRVVMSGTPIGTVRNAVADDLGLPRGIRVIAGASDGTAGFLSSGAVGLGEFNTTLGTTLVIKGIAPAIVKDPMGRVYSHAHPSGYWLPGGASNVGGECLKKHFGGQNLWALDARAAECFPSRPLVYPLVRKGERFPFVNSAAEGFEIGECSGEAERYAAYLEGVAFVERWCYELLAELGCAIRPRIYCTGGGSRSEVWMRLRADILNRTLARPAESEPAFGMAVLAAAAVIDDGSIGIATRRMVRIAREFAPDEQKTAQWDEKYGRFREECARRGMA